MWHTRKKLIFFLICATFIIILAPQTLDEHHVESIPLLDQSPSLIPDLPKMTPEYSVHGFNYVSIQKGQKQWNIQSDVAYFYNAGRLVHTKNVIAYLFALDGGVTEIKGQEGRYFIGDKDIEVYGDVHTKLPDGFEISSQYAHYKQANILIPGNAIGHGTMSQSQLIDFTSQGLTYLTQQAKIVLPHNVHFLLQSPTHSTTIQSDRCVIYRDTHQAKFSMYQGLLHIQDGELNVSAQKADLVYEDTPKLINYMTAHGKVTILETRDQRYSTAGRADFDSKSNTVTLTIYPQAYQGTDTVTGERMILHRDTDEIEIHHSNARSN